MSLHLLLLAAGEGRRFGGAVKQLAPIGEKTLLEHALDTALSLAPERVSVVLGFRHQRLAPLLGPAQPVVNPRWAEGLGSSIACGVAALPASAGAVLIMLADQPALKREDLAELTGLFERADSEAKPIVCSGYADGVGVPAIFPRRFFEQLQALTGDRGAKEILQQNPVLTVPLANAAVDIDTQEQWRQFVAQSLLNPLT